MVLFLLNKHYSTLIQYLNNINSNCIMSSDTSSGKSATSFTEDEQHVAGNAQNFFKAGQYDATLGILKKLQKYHSNDIRLMHNRALAEFCKSGKTKVFEFKKGLVKIQKLVLQSNKDDDDYVAGGEKNNYLPLYYNQALLLYNIHQYSETENILERLYENLDVSEEAFFLKISLLLIDTYLATYHAEKAGNLIAMIEKTFLSSDDAAKKNANSEAKSTPILTSAEAESLRAHLHYLKTRCYIQLKSVKLCKREIKLLGNVSSASAGGSQTNVVNVASVFLKSNVEYVRCNYHKAYKQLGVSLPPSGSSNITASGMQEGLYTMYYNNLAVIHFSMGKYHIGSFYMQKALQENDAVVTMATKQHHSNFGGGGRHQQQSNAKPLYVLNINKRFELLYNCGIQLLHAGNPGVAFDCFLAAVHAFHNNPRLWLRLAECCIQKCTSCSSDGGLKHSGKKSQQQNNSTFSVIGNGSYRKVVVNTMSQSIGGKGNNVVMPSPTLEFASVCLNNALTLLQQAMNAANGHASGEKAETVKHNGSKSAEGTLTIPYVACLPGAPVSGHQFAHLYASVLVNSSFVALNLGNAVLALEYAETLLSLPKLAGSHRYLGHMYAAEALVSLDRISEAIQHLSTEEITSISVDVDDNGKKSPISDDGSTKSGQSNNDNNNQRATRHTVVVDAWHFPTNLSCAHGYMILNLANAHCLRSEYEKAQRLLRNANSLVTAKQAPPQALTIAVYLALLSSGNGITTALQMLRYNALVLTPQQAATAVPGTWTNNGGTLRQIAATATNGISNSGGTGGDSSSSSTTSSAPRSKSNTPQPGSGGITPERVVKAKNSEGKKRNRR